MLSRPSTRKLSSRPSAFPRSSALRPSSASDRPAPGPLALPSKISLVAALLGLISTGLALPASAAEPQIFRSADKAAALQGERDGVSIDADGSLRLAPRLERLVAIEEPFVYSASRRADGGWVVGTGSSGKVFGLDPAAAADRSEERAPVLLATLPESEIFAVLGRADGTVVAGSSPEGRVYSLRDGQAEPLLETGATYVWDLAEDSNNRLLVATGLPGRLLREGRRGGEPEVLWQSPDDHVRTVLPLDDGSVLVGTAGQGLVVHVAADGRSARTLYDGGEPEVLAFARAEGSRVYAALLASEASFVDLSDSDEEAADSGDATNITIGSRGAGHSGPRSRLLELDLSALRAMADESSSPGSAAGSWARARKVAELESDTIHSLAWTGGSLWVGTGQEGHLFRLVDDELVREADFDERQLVALLPDGEGGALVVTTDAGAAHRLHAELAAEGRFSSPVLDAGQLARFGLLRWRGRVPEGTSVTFEVRSGMAAEPDATWTDWRSLEPAADGSRDQVRRRDLARGLDRELSLGALGAGRYVQWRVRLAGAAGVRNRSTSGGSSVFSPVVDSVELTYRQVNLEPEITELEVLDAGQILVAQNFNPTSTTFEPWTPNRDGIFTSLRQEKESSQQKQLWKRGYRTLRWQAEDGNEDALRYALAVRADGDRAWLPMAENLEETWYSFDSTVLPDGVYRFRLRASDEEDNPPGETLASTEISERVVVDHTPPAIDTVRRIEGGFEVTVIDALVPVRDAVYSIDAGPWLPAPAADGLLDGRRETLRIEAPADAQMVLLRLTDAAHNVVTSKLD